MSQKATFSLGCFWEPDDFFSKLDGILKTQVGYSGGEKKNPTYHNLGKHTETVEITYDPQKISYKELLTYFWKLHNPTIPQHTQYKSIIFYHDAEQKKLAEESLKEEQKKYKKPILTDIKKAGTFYKAEEYHQKYLRKCRV